MLDGPDVDGEVPEATGRSHWWRPGSHKKSWFYCNENGVLTRNPEEVVSYRTQKPGLCASMHFPKMVLKGSAVLRV